MILYEVDDYFYIDGKHIICLRIPNGDKFPIEVGNNLMEDDEPYNVLEVEWFHPSSIPCKYRSVAIVVDRPINIGTYLRLAKFKPMSDNMWE